ncbi:MAG: ADP-ribosylation/crystallin [Acidobacteria bacterium]|nr:ADP-ribosylation/crystallin [Acidobacteriota bacterium]
MQTLGGGWVAEEALAIAVYAALCHPADLRAALRLAANHSGDSDSTASICGHLLGAALGEAALPADWLAVLEGRDVIRQLADDLLDEGLDLRPGEGSRGYAAWFRRYPGA